MSLGPEIITRGIYEIKHTVSKSLLGSLNSEIAENGVLVLRESAGSYTRWQIIRIGKGYVIKHLASGMYCSLPEGRDFLHESIILSDTPTVWAITYIDNEEKTAQISWGVSKLYWDATVPGKKELVIPKLEEVRGGKLTSSTWQLLFLGSGRNDPPSPPRPQVPAGQLQPGVYSLQNKASRTYVSLSADEKSIACWPAGSYKLYNAQLWEISRFGDGYTIKLHGTDKYCTLQNGIKNGCDVSVCNIPAAWRIAVVDSPLRDDPHGVYIQIFWANTQMAWDLKDGKNTPGNSIHVRDNKVHRDFRVFRLEEPQTIEYIELSDRMRVVLT